MGYKAGIGTTTLPALQWSYHCEALEKYKENMSENKSKLVKKPAQDFKMNLKYIIQETDPKKQYLKEKDFYIHASESTSVQPKETAEDYTEPFWAK